MDFKKNRLERWLITPEFAMELLTRNRNNRKVSKSRVNQYASEMLAGTWMLNGEAIKFSVDGDLVDGQHRLLAIIQANIPITMDIIFGIESDVTIFDRGRSRSEYDSFLMEGMDKTLATSKNIATAKLHYLVQKGSDYCTHEMINSFLNEHKGELRTISRILGKRGKQKTFRVATNGASFELAFLYAHLCGVSINTLENFADCFRRGMYEGINQSSAIVLRNDCIAGNIVCSGQTNRLRALAQIEKAIYDFQNGIERKNSYRNWNTPIYSNIIKEKKANGGNI